MAKIYTKYGDNGYTYTKQNPKTPKNHLLVHILGDLDELNANLGYLHSLVHLVKDKIEKNQSKIDSVIESLQKIEFFIQTQIEMIFNVGAFIGYNTDLSKDSLSEITISIENFIDEQELQNGNLQNFILPVGTKASTFAHICRAVCRRAERNFYDMSDKEKCVETLLAITTYLNRLSDSLFSISRSLNRMERFKEILWTKKD